MDWRFDNVAVVIFVTESPKDVLSAWTKIFPDRSPDHLKTHSAVLSIASGVYEDCRIMMVLQPRRIECRLLPVEDETAAKPSTFVEVDPVIDRALDIGRQLCLDHEVSRIALHVNAVREFETIEAANERVIELSPLEHVPHAYDLLCRVNVRRISQHDGAPLINRICTWSAATRQWAAFQVSTAEGAPTVSTSSLEMSPIVQLQLDVNTAPIERLDPALCEPLLNEISEETRNLLLNGFEHLLES